ncbi:Mannosylglycoprotein endo-beta-mannosidase [Camellia lanceoleosa]|uniref:Mannosylglycoprotein endo-beta-mannosidase n=1 Tax=Camellia lanceoleosa TaxID=1840588 RepID=A0ACC0IRY1_9ERIC|nr:Mannosylglycoprotein endo-beta-mannosidase [Camellia lanceoleosa]
MAEIGNTKLDSGWLAARSTEVELTGVQLTTTHPPSSAPNSPWMEAVVPGTVLATLVKNKVVSDPFYGLENESIIDIADSGREYYTFWFFTTFKCKLSRNQHVDLNFRAINYSAEVYLNGHKKVLPKGMFRRHSLDVTDILHPDGENLLAVLVHPPDHPGRIPPEGGQGGDHEIGKDVAAQYVEGWDWMIPIRDRNTGIWDEVSISVTGPVKIVDPHLVSSFFDDYKRVYLHTTTGLVNRSAWVADCSLNIQVTTELEGSIFLVEHLQTEHVSIPPGASVEYTIPELFFYKPNLWWPNGMGKQSLYNVGISIDVKGFGVSDLWSHHFGFRKIESHIDSATGGRLFKVNGQPVFIRGGNWILSDGLLRLSKKRYKTDIKFHADMNFNMIRCWGGGLAERPEFYHYCDIYGLLVWQEFWITGDCDGRGVPISNPDGPLDHDLFLLCAKDTVKLLRNHPSLALWVGGNEQVPPEDINTALKNELKLHPLFENSTENSNSKEDRSEVLRDPSQYLDGTRIYIQGSMWDGFANGKGDFTDGPYEIQYPESFFKDDFYEYGFNPEVGSVGMPVAATIRATMPREGWQIPLFNKLPDGYVQEVPNPIWEYHKYIPYSKPSVVHDQILLYGTPKDLDDFCLKAQLVNYVQYRALLEGWTSRMWSKYTGVLIWKNQNPWTGLRGQFYDHLHDQTAGFYGCRAAAEPIHVQLNLATYFVEVVNTTSEELSDVAIEVSVWDLEGTCPYYKVSEKLSVPSKRTVTIFEMKYPKSKNPKPVYFLLLKLYNISDYGILSRNFYWLYPPGGDYKLLELYKTKKLPLKIESHAFIGGSTYEIQMHVKNMSKKPDSKNLLYKNSFIERNDDSDFDMSSLEPMHSRIEEKQEGGLIRRIFNHFSSETNGLRVTEINGSEVGVAFFLHFSVHVSKTDHKEGEDTRILPVHYSHNYFSLVPGEEMSVNLSFEVPPGVTPRVTLHGWNYHAGHTVY